MTIIHDTPDAAKRRLSELGVSVEALQRATAAGHAARITCTENDPPFIPGTVGWSYTVRTLRDELVPHNWRKADPRNFPLVTNDSRRLNIVVESGDQATRLLHMTPRTKSLKGLFMEAVTLRNNIEFDLFPETLAEELRRAMAILEYPTWVLLIHITDDEYRAELSLPDQIKNSNIIGWKERIFIPDVDEPFGARIDETDEREGPDFDIPVRRRA